MRPVMPRSNRPRRGVTLVEMLVVVALVLLMMTILVQIFQSATGAMTASRAVQELDVSLRSVDLRLRQDLAGVTARLTPPLDPTLKLGYFEYGENAFADTQGEDTDDYLAFTTKAPEGQVFTGRVYVANEIKNGGSVASSIAVQPVTVTSQLAEVIYFLRNGNLYRRVFLIVPERQGSMSSAVSFQFPALSNKPTDKVSWIAVNDVSARPASVGFDGTPVLNHLGDLTNRENRAFRPRFRSDFFDLATTANPDRVDDDFNGDDVPDFYPTLYPNAVIHSNPHNRTKVGLINEDPFAGFDLRTKVGFSYDVYPFPYIFPGMFSRPASLTNGWIHSLDPTGTTFNHAPLGPRDNLASPDLTDTNALQTWWGFPTWRESISALWKDPVLGVSFSTLHQQNGLRPFPPDATPKATIAADSTYANNLLPALSQFGTDGLGGTSFATAINGVWDDDLILTNVRSFDVKVYDPDAALYSTPAAATPAFLSAGYYDLGYGINLSSGLGTSTPSTLWDANTPPYNLPQGFGHAGRIPPLVADVRAHPSRSSINVGDDSDKVIRLTRVWDTWSTDYTNAPDVDVNLNGYSGLPIYPSYPAPYPSPLRGIQVQIRVADPRNERIKVLTIRQDFTDKL